MSPPVSRVAVAECAARVGGEAANTRFRGELEAENKSDPAAHVVNPGDVVTEGDRLAQRRVLEYLERVDPETVVVAEEAGAQKTIPDEGFAWVLDPIDGTYNYARGAPNWTTSLAGLQDRRPVVSATSVPALEDVYVTTEQVRHNGAVVSVSDRSAPEYCTVAPIAIPPYGDRKPYARAVASLLTTFGNLRRYGSAQLTLARVAEGTIDGAITTTGLAPWDTAAGVHAIRIAGGQVTAPNGEPWTIDSPGLVASNGRIHDELLAVARTMDGPEDDQSV
ncbi:inositol monophosphatase [Natronococcus pandeyae]|uniref:fructose-bisphosphatase n=1 Tax=Natronococcus pandeyae TaxID=2055836 RepID=A0A8J8TP34_9EURY|nr:inositol monophosphatase [Natronococcus pandeyae]TYL37356.1 inositol monophosphatase [Natronococcus pandeyae]